MSINKPLARSVGTLFALVFFGAAVSAQEPGLIAGQNINMVSGTEWPDGDPFLQRQNEPTIAVSTRNELHLMGGSNDYRTIDLPDPLGGEGKTVGDSWTSAYFSTDGGGRWTSTLLPGYPQDNSMLGSTSPLKMAGYEASADPVIRAGTHGLFYYSGIAFTRGDAPPSAGFVATYMDLNNDERKNAIGYVRTRLFDQNLDGTSFIDKPWIAVDKPRPGAQRNEFIVNTAGGELVEQIVEECGHVYVAYARIQGDGSAAIRSQIMFNRSKDCAESFPEPPIQLSLPNTINQGAAIAVEPVLGRIQVAWRQFENATMSCTRKAKFWRKNPEAWPVDEFELAGRLVRKEDGGKFVVLEGDEDDSHETEAFDEDDFEDDADKPSGVFRQALAAWLNILSGADSSAITQVLGEAETWLVDNPPGVKPAKEVKRAGDTLRKILRNYNKGKFGPGRCEDKKGDGANGMLSGMHPDAIMVVTSNDFGNTFSAPVAVTGPDYFPFEQGTTEFSFRTTGFPTMTFDGKGRSYIAYSTRGLAIPDSDTVGGDARIVVTTLINGATWTPPQPIDEPSVAGHQLMPAFEFSRGKVFLLYYDFREDVSGVFDRFITDLPVDLATPRHSADVRVAQADAADVPVFTDNSVLDGASTQTSRYPFLILDNGGTPVSQQMLYNPPNLPMFKGGTVPFFGDYIDIAALRFIRDEATGQWEFDTDPATGAPVLHAVWTDNRDVVGPPDGDWASYVPPGDEVVEPSTFDPAMARPVCTPAFDFDRTKMRNQNIYTSRLTQGLAVAVPGNNRELGLPNPLDPLETIQRVFVGFIQNLTGDRKYFRLEIVDPLSSEVIASFDQFDDFVTMLSNEVVEPNSSISRSIYVKSSFIQSASVDIRVVEVNEFGTADVTNGLTATLRINPDPSAPAPDDADIQDGEFYTPAIFNPAIFNDTIFNDALLGTDPNVGILSNPAIFNPAIFNQSILMQLALLNPAIFNPAIFNPAIFNLDPANPAIFNPAIFNPAIFNPAIFNPAIFNPAIFNPAIFNPAIFNPAIFNPAIFNPAIFNRPIDSTLVETSVVIENTGNATAAYSLNLDFDNPPDGFLFQVMIYRTYLVPSVEGCKLTEEVVQESLVNELTRDVNGSLLNPDSTSFYIPPGDNVVATVRIIPDPNAAVPGDPSTIDTLDTLNLPQSVVPQAVDTEGLANGETEPTPVIILAPSATAGIVDQQQPTINDTGGGFAIGTFEVFEQKLAQVVTTGLTGLLAEVRLPVSCSSGDLVVEIQGLTDGQPNGTVLASETIAGGSIPTFPAGTSAFRTIRFGSPAQFAQGEQFAIVLSSLGECSILRGGPVADSYAGGDGFVDVRPDLTGWRLLGQDLPFKTVVLPGAGTGVTIDSVTFDSVTSCVFDQSNDLSVSPNGYVIPGFGDVGQTFTPTASSLDVVELQMNVQVVAGGGDAGDAFLRIRSGGITGSILGTSNIITNVGLAKELVRFDFSVPVPLTPGQTHTIEVVHSSGVKLGVFIVGTFGTDTYSGGTAIALGGARPDDLWFRESSCADSTGTLTIDGAFVDTIVNISNFTGSTLSDVVLTARIDQLGAFRLAGDNHVQCGGTFGDLPPGTCNTRLTVSADNLNTGSGTLTAGPATARFELIVFDGESTSILDTLTVPITLIGPF